MSVTTKRRDPDTDARRLFKEIRALAVKRGPDVKLPTTRELSAKFDTSRITLDNVLRQLEEDQIIYRRQGSGIYVSPKIYRKTIVVLLDASFFSANSSPFWGILWAQFAKAAEHRSDFKDEDFQFHMVTPPAANSSPLPELIMKDIEAGTVDGVLCIGLPPSVIEWIDTRGVPTVTFAAPGKWIVGLGLDCACRIAVGSLASSGCRTIGLWSLEIPDGEEDTGIKKAIARYRSALSTEGLAYDPALFIDRNAAAIDAVELFPTGQELGYNAALRLFGQSQTPKPDGLVIEDDMMADGVITGLEELGIRVGSDVKIAAYTNAGSPTLFSHRKKLTRIEFNPNDISMAMLNILDEAMAGSNPAPREVEIEPTVKRTD